VVIYQGRVFDFVENCGGLLLFLITAQHWSKAVIKQANHVTRSQEMGTHLDWDLDLLLLLLLLLQLTRSLFSCVVCFGVWRWGFAWCIASQIGEFFRFSSLGEKENLVTFIFGYLHNRKERCCDDGAHVHQVVPEALLQTGDAHSHGGSRRRR
jgi:hypothetical protein